MPGIPGKAAHSAHALHLFRRAGAGELLHHLIHHIELLEQPVDVLDLHAGACRDAALAAVIQDGGIFALIRRHGLNDRLGARHGLFIDGRALERAGVHARHHACQIFQAAHALELRQLVIEIGKREFVAAELLLQLLGLLLIERSLCLFDQRQHVAHAENARGHAAGMERLDTGRAFRPRR